MQFQFPEVLEAFYANYKSNFSRVLTELRTVEEVYKGSWGKGG
jgi:hypothetical protein